nr:uncharacterized protein LOC109181161 [Ipomoea batatas]
MKDSRRIMELAKLCSEVPWNLPESVSATIVAAQSAPAPTIVAGQSATASADVAAQSATASADIAAQSATAFADVAAQSATASADVAARSETAPPDVAPMPQVFAQLLPITEPGSSVVPAAATLKIIAPPSASSDSFAAAAAPSSTSQLFSTAQTHVQNAMSSAAPTDRRVFAPHGHSGSSQFEFADGVFPVSNKQKATSFELSCVGSQAATINAVVTNIPSANINVLPSDKQVPSVISSGTLNFQVPSFFSLCSKSESKVLLPFQSSQSHNIKFGSFSQPMSNESTSDLASSEKLVSDVIKSHDVSLVTTLPTTDLSLDSIRVSILEIQSVHLVSVPFSAPDQCNPVASRTRKSKAKLANRVIPLRGQVSVSHSLQKPSGFPLPILLNKSVQAAWSINRDRSLLLQRNIDVENFTACCNLIDLLRSQNLLQTVTNVGPYCDLVAREFYSNLTEATVDRDSDHFHNVFLRRHWYDFSPAVINDFFDRIEVDDQFSPDYDLIASSLSNSHYRTWPKRDTKKPGKQGDIESSFLPSSYAILLRMATTNWLPTVTVHSVSKKMDVLLFKIRNNIPFNLGELIFDHIMAFRHGQGKEDKVLLPFSSLIYGILCKQGFRKHPQEEELSPTSVYSIDRRLFFKSHFDDCSTFKSAVVPEGESVSSTRSRVSVDFAAVSARVLTTQSIIKSLKSTVVQMEKVLLEDQMLLQSFETDEMDLDSAR